eukprot:Pgem_evm1s6002
MRLVISLPVMFCALLLVISIPSFSNLIGLFTGLFFTTINTFVPVVLFYYGWKYKTSLLYKTTRKEYRQIQMNEVNNNYDRNGNRSINENNYIFNNVDDGDDGYVNSCSSSNRTTVYYSSTNAISNDHNNNNNDYNNDNNDYNNNNNNNDYDNINCNNNNYNVNNNYNYNDYKINNNNDNYNNHNNNNDHNNDNGNNSNDDGHIITKTTRDNANLNEKGKQRTSTVVEQNAKFSLLSLFTVGFNLQIVPVFGVDRTYLIALAIIGLPLFVMVMSSTIYSIAYET